jgi:hypothetical protein
MSRTSEIVFSARTTPTEDLRLADASSSDRGRGRPITTWAIVKPSSTSPNGYVLADPDAEPLFDTDEATAASTARSQNPRWRAARASDFYYRRYA